MDYEKKLETKRFKEFVGTVTVAVKTVSVIKHYQFVTFTIKIVRDRP